MRFVHRTDPERRGELAASKKSPKEHTIVFERGDAQGKPRAKTFKKKKGAYPAAALESLWSTALRFVFKEGFIAPAPQPKGPVRWLTVTEEAYPHGYPFAVDRERGFVWVADTGWLRRIERGSCAQVDVPVGTGVMARAVAVDAAGRVSALLDIEDGGAAAGSPPWRAPSRGAFSYAIVRLTEALEVEPLAVVPQPDPGTLMNALSMSDDGLVLGPHAGGAAIYDDAGAVVASFSAARTKHDPPKAGLSPSGRFVALTHGEGAIRIVDREDGERVVEGPFSQVHGLDVEDDGEVLVRGFGPEDWGLYVIGSEGGPTSISADLNARRAPDRASVVEVTRGRVRVCPATSDRAARAPQRESALPTLGMSRAGVARHLDGTAVIVRTDAHTLAEIDLERLKKA